MISFWTAILTKFTSLIAQKSIKNLSLEPQVEIKECERSEVQSSSCSPLNSSSQSEDEGDEENEIERLEPTISWSNGDYYIGETKEGQPHGSGKIFYKNGDIFQGNFHNGIKEGYGTHTYHKNCTSKLIFEQGNYHKDSLHGSNCQQVFIEGHYAKSYVGHFKEGKKFNVVAKYNNGDIYEGHFDEYARRSGEGIYKYNENSKCDYEQGNFYKGELHSLKNSSENRQMSACKQVFKSGNTYSGEFKNGKKHGRISAIFIINEKQEYFEGMYENDKKNGFGSYAYVRSGIRIVDVGEWRDDRFIG